MLVLYACRMEAGAAATLIKQVYPEATLRRVVADDFDDLADQPLLEADWIIGLHAPCWKLGAHVIDGPGLLKQVHEALAAMEAPRPPRRLYVASSWRNDTQPAIVDMLHVEGYEVYDFHHPEPDIGGFHWSDIDPEWKTWSPEQFRSGLSHPVARHGFALDFDAMRLADTCVLVNPCGRSAHIEAGFFVGHPRKRLVILLGEEGEEPELMYRMADAIVIRPLELLETLRRWAP